MISNILFFVIVLMFAMFNNRWGGPLPRSWLDQQLHLQKRVLARMHELGMTPGSCQLPLYETS